MSVIVIDPGHGGAADVGGSDANHAQSPSGVLEKTLTLDIARRVRWSLTNGTGKDRANQLGKQVSVVMTRDGDTNLSLDERASTAALNDAELYLSLHFNGWDGKVRGSEAYVDRKYLLPHYTLSAGKKVANEGPGNPKSGLRNINVAADAAYAAAIVAAAVAAMTTFGAGPKLRSAKYTAAQNGEAYTPPPGVKMLGLGALRDAKLGTAGNDCRACLLEIEFMDHPDVDKLLNGATAGPARNALAAALAVALVQAL